MPTNYQGNPNMMRSLSPRRRKNEPQIKDIRVLAGSELRGNEANLIETDAHQVSLLNYKPTDIRLDQFIAFK